MAEKNHKEYINVAVLLLVMKIIYADFKHGEVKLEIETADDLWTLTYIIEKGDVVKGKTLRKIKATEASEGVKKQIFLALKVEKVEFSESSVQLRITGTVISAPEDVPKGSYHSFGLEPGSVIAIEKEEWLSYQMEKLKESAETKMPKILICVFDREEATFAILRRKGYEILLNLKGDVERKRMKEKPKTVFYEELIKKLNGYDKRFEFDKIILASPSFWKEELNKHLKNLQLKQKIIQSGCSGADENAIKEVLKRDELKEALKQDRISKEMKIVEELLSEISKEGKSCYGKKETEEASEQGAVETLLITDALIKKYRIQGNFSEIEKILKKTEKNKGKIIIISSEYEAGKKLDGLGGVAGLLRWKI